MTSFFRFLLVSLAFTLGTINFSHAASFDCTKATTETEIAICNDPELSALDEEMSKVYSLLDKDGRYYQQITDSQRSWIKNERKADIHDFKQRLSFLKIGSTLNTCLADQSDQKWMNDCSSFAKQNLDECENEGNYTTAYVNLCNSSYLDVLSLIETYETKNWITQNAQDQETLNLFKPAYELWKKFVESDCEWQYSYFRHGSVRGYKYLTCSISHHEKRIDLIHSLNVR
jgi:uncharacterized protein YecT (DUF1311 family)